MNRTVAYGYIMIGFLAGIAFGIDTEGDPIITLQRIAYFTGALVLILLYQWFENTSHKRHLAKWDRHRQRGKWSFLLSHYMLSRGIIVALLICLPFLSKVRLTSDPLLVLILTAAIALFSFAFLGYQQCSSCEQDFQIQSLRETAERMKQSSSPFQNGGGA